MTVPIENTQIEQGNKINETVDFITENYIVEPYVYIAMDLVWKSEQEIDIVLNDNFPKSKTILKNAIVNAQSKIIEKTGIQDFEEIKRQIENK